MDFPSGGFRNRYLSYAELTAQLRAWAESYPNLCRLDSLGRTPEGREQWLLVVGRQPEHIRPAAWVDGNLHAGEFAGSSVALAIAEDMLRLLSQGELDGLPRPVAERLAEVLFYVVPRISPDGAEHVLDTGRFVRSVPRDERLDRGRARWRASDVNGDGLSLLMRVEDPGGEFVESKDVPGLMLEREIEHEGPYYKIYPEGTIEHFDGQHIPAPRFLDDNPIDLNRNFPWSWAPAHEQIGAGPFPTSEPEARNVTAFAVRHPEIFAWLNLHTFGGVGIRPLGHAPDSKMDPGDRAVFRQIERWLEEHTGYPMVSGYEEFLYEPDKPLRGDLSEFAYPQRGAISYVIELWDLFARIGMPRPKRFVEHYERFGPGDLLRLARWDKEHNEGRIFKPWQRIQHPQLGPVEVGGLDPRIGIWNPPLAELAKVCADQSRAFLRVAALAPAIEIEAPTVTPVGDGLSRVELRVQNRGYLPTHILGSAKQLDFNEPLYADCELAGPALVDPGQRHVVVGHLEGWGRGRFSGQAAPHFLRSTGNGHSAWLGYVVRGRGVLRVRVGSCRVGFVEAAIEV
jgi:hypothetical protein